jgi:pimeloyl-ACP methyl ester carboxylesterase
VLCVLASALVVSTSPDLSAQTESGNAQTLEWEACESGEQCAELEVPLDDTVDDGRTITIVLIRHPARVRSRRIGSLIVNNGGPGVSAFDFVRDAASSLPDELLDRFDIVGFDPRGVERTTPVDCTDDMDPYFDLEWTPDNSSERTELVDGVSAVVEQCESMNGPLLQYLRTERVARDMDRIRAALGDDKLTFLGYSYGSYLGAWYAEQFPTRVRAFVFDGPVDPSLTGEELQVQQAVGFEHSLELFLEACAKDEGCAFHRDGRTAQAYDRLRAQVGDEPLPVRGEEGRTLNGTRFDLAVTQILYEGRAAWRELGRVLDRAADGDPSDLLFYADFYTGREGDREYTDAQEAFIAIGCADGPPVGDLVDFQQIEAKAAERAPRLGSAIVNGSLACALWPFNPPAPRKLRAEDADPILVIGTRNDPATPFRWARGLTRQLDSGVLLSVRGEQHTVFGSGNECVDAIVIRYFVRLEVPERGTRC